MIYLEALSKVLPILLLFLLGAFLRRTRFLRDETVGDLKKLVVNVTLPAVLFLAFAGVSLESRHLVIVAIVFAGCVLALLLGRALRPLAAMPSPYFLMLMTGFEAGMMGYAIFGAVYGAANIFKFAIIDLGQVLFVFFVLVTTLQRQASGARPFSETLLNFLKTPVILSIFAGIVANRAGVTPLLAAWPISAAVLKTVELLGGLTTPLIALIIGYEVRIERGNLLQPAKAVAIRLLMWIPAGLLLNALVIGPLFGADRLLRAAVMTMFVLPPPFVAPLFMKDAATEDRAFVVNTLSLATLMTLIAFTVVSVLYP
ncbi:MAG: permease [Chloroflexi bacterium]|nr:permease [Chloroflexota bacterium]